MITVLPALAALAVLRRAPQHRPIALALWLAAGIELVRPHLPARAALVCMLALPALSAWATLRTLVQTYRASPVIAAWALAAALVLLLPRPSTWWTWAWPGGFGLGCAIEAIAVVIWWRRGRLTTVTQETALVLAGGDLGALVARSALGLEAWRVWALLVAVIATVVQARFLLRSGTIAGCSGQRSERDASWFWRRR